MTISILIEALKEIKKKVGDVHVITENDEIVSCINFIDKYYHKSKDIKEKPIPVIEIC